MCRLLVVRAERPFAIIPHLEKLAHISKNSKEYQGHGWGCAYKDDKGKWKLYKNINPLWEHDFVEFPATTLLLALSPDQNLRGMLFWLMGDLNYAYAPAQSLTLLAIITLAGIIAARNLNVLARGDLQAAIVGLPVTGFRMLVFAVTALATAISVTTVGVIGFIGLVVPHLIRIAAGSDHRIVLPASALAGGILLVLADTLARTVLAPRQLPVGALTATLGVPLFLILMSKSRHSG